jgi:hypothetical protein
MTPSQSNPELSFDENFACWEDPPAAVMTINLTAHKMLSEKSLIPPPIGPFSSSALSKLSPHFAPKHSNVVRYRRIVCPEAQGNHNLHPRCISSGARLKASKRCYSHFSGSKKVYPVHAYEVKVSDHAIERQHAHQMTVWHLEGVFVA